MQKDKDNLNLKPYPFCGATELLYDYAYYDALTTFWIECKNCGVLLEKDTKEEVITRWNTRVQSKEKNNEEE